MQSKELLVVCGPSGAGKSVLISHLMKRFPNKFGFSVSHTSREPRGSEVDGVDYHFCSNSTFVNMISENSFVEYANVHNYHYGTSKQAIQDVLNTGRYCILDIDIQGVQLVRKSQYADRANYIGVLPKSVEALEERLGKRNTDSRESIRVRLENSIREIEEIKNSNFIDVIVNDNIDKFLEEIEALILKYWPEVDN
ncbi:guanylate kinase [Cryptosporidium ryanae]|uniref:guanylate kinase n=1 Tax=Cryptosporidium ryanae TaxID=515981 RepID=UPI00351A931F|nr:guanylate kinase [Cryptosporidium ryanae]